jgi:hypothetical protein
MTKRTRYFMMGSVGFLTLGLTVGLAAYYGGIRGLAAPAGPDELSYVPSDAVVVAYANVKDLMASQFRQQVKSLEPASREQGQEELKNTLGIDVERDIDSVVACMLAPPAGTASSDAKSGYILARGHFDQPRIEAFIREKGGIEQVYHGRKMFVHPADAAAATTDGASHDLALTFVDPNVVALGTPAALQTVIDVQRGAAPNVVGNRELMAMIKGVDSGNAWVVGRFDVLSKQAHLSSDVQRQLPQITWFSATGHVNGGLSGTVAVQARDHDAAANLQQVVAGFIALARMQAASRPELNALVQSISLNNDVADNTVSVSFVVPTGALEALKAAGAAKHLQK